MPNREKTIKRLEHLSEWLFHLYQVVCDGDAPDYYDAYKTVDDAIDLLKEKPEIVRCSDCIYHHYDNDHIPYCERIDYGYGWKDNDFCSRGERREAE